MSAPLFSVVVPVYNAEMYIEQLSESFEKQTSDCFEVIYVDDGSTDQSLELLHRITTKVGYAIKIVSQKNMGASAARNAGIAIAEGEYITFADADDAISDSYIETHAQNARLGYDVIAYTHARTVRGEISFTAESVKAGLSNADDLFSEFVINPTKYGVYDFLIKKKMLIENHITFPEGYAYYEDYDFIINFLALTKTVYRAEKCVYCYRAAAGSAMNVFTEERLQCLQLFSCNARQMSKRSAEAVRKYDMWFLSRLKWSVMWQACIFLTVKEAVAFGRKYEMRKAMLNLTNHPDARVALSARLYLVWPRVYIITMNRMGRRRTLLPHGKMT